jgi:hypothetical protein
LLLPFVAVIVYVWFDDMAFAVPVILQSVEFIDIPLGKAGEIVQDFILETDGNIEILSPK